MSADCDCAGYVRSDPRATVCVCGHGLSWHALKGCFARNAVKS